jgi:predicted Zn-dependent peptidase
VADVERLTANDLIDVAQTIFNGNKYLIVGKGNDE